MPQFNQAVQIPEYFNVTVSNVIVGVPGPIAAQSALLNNTNALAAPTAQGVNAWLAWLDVPTNSDLASAIANFVVTTDSRLSDSREWTAETVSQVEAEAGTATTRRAWTAQRVRQAAVQLLVDFGIAALPEQFDDADWDV